MSWLSEPVDVFTEEHLNGVPAAHAGVAERIKDVRGF
jgi:hypothetical protein